MNSLLHYFSLLYVHKLQDHLLSLELWDVQPVFHCNRSLRELSQVSLGS